MLSQAWFSNEPLLDDTANCMLSFAFSNVLCCWPWLNQKRPSVHFLGSGPTSWEPLYYKTAQLYPHKLHSALQNLPKACVLSACCSVCHNCSFVSSHSSVLGCWRSIFPIYSLLQGHYRIRFNHQCNTVIWFIQKKVELMQRLEWLIWSVLVSMIVSHRHWTPIWIRTSHTVSGPMKPESCLQWILSLESWGYFTHLISRNSYQMGRHGTSW